MRKYWIASSARIEHPWLIPHTSLRVNTSADARKLAKSRVAEISPPEHLQFSYCSSLDELPATIDLAVISATDVHAGRSFEALLGRLMCAHCVLEKFLFQSHVRIMNLSGLIAARKVPAFVNTPRRAWPVYRQLAAELGKAGPVSIMVELNRTNGMATNAIHFIDLAAYLTASPDGFAMDSRNLQAVEGVSRHAGAVEIEGLLQGVSARGDCFSIRGQAAVFAPHVIVITTHATAGSS